MHYSGIMSAIQTALNLGGISALIAGVFLLVKGKGDARLTLAQLRQKTDAEERTADQADIKIVSDQRTQAATELERTNLRVVSDRDYWQKRAEKAEGELGMRNTTLAEFGTNYAEMFYLMAIPGAMDALRLHRDAARQTTTTITQTQVVTTETAS